MKAGPVLFIQDWSCTVFWSYLEGLLRIENFNFWFLAECFGILKAGEAAGAFLDTQKTLET